MEPQELGGGGGGAARTLAAASLQSLGSHPKLHAESLENVSAEAHIQGRKRTQCGTPTQTTAGSRGGWGCQPAAHPAPGCPGHLPMASRSRRLPCSGGMAYLREKAGTSELRA